MIDTGPRFHEKVMKSISFGMGMYHQRDIACFSLWISRNLASGTLTPTYFTMHDENEPLTDELRHEIVESLRRLADNVEGKNATPRP